MHVYVFAHMCVHASVDEIHCKNRTNTTKFSLSIIFFLTFTRHKTLKTHSALGNYIQATVLIQNT